MIKLQYIEKVVFRLFEFKVLIFTTEFFGFGIFGDDIASFITLGNYKLMSNIPSRNCITYIIHIINNNINKLENAHQTYHHT